MTNQENQISSLPKATIILKQSLNLYKERFGTFLGIAFIPVILTTILFIILTNSSALIFNTLSSNFSLTKIILLAVLGIIIFLITILLQALGGTALIYAIKDSDEKIGVWEAYRRGWRKTCSYLWFLILGGLIILGGFLLLIIPGIVFIVWFSLGFFTLIAENLKGLNALLKSKEYVKGHWWSTFGKLLLIFVIIFIISYVLVFIFKVLKIPYGEFLSRFLIIVFLTPLLMSYLFLIYKNLKNLKGELSYLPSKKQKIIFIIIALIGLLGILIIPFLFISKFLNFNLLV